MYSKFCIEAVDFRVKTKQFTSQYIEEIVRYFVSTFLGGNSDEIVT